MHRVPNLESSHVRAYLGLLTASARLENAVDADLRARVGLTFAQFEILVRVGDSDKGLRMAEIADRLVLSPSGLSYQVQQLEKRGLLIRQRDTTDERGIIAALTTEGRAIVADATPGHVALVEQRVFAGLSDDTLRHLADTLDAISENIEGKPGRTG